MGILRPQAIYPTGMYCSLGALHHCWDMLLLMYPPTAVGLQELSEHNGTHGGTGLGPMKPGAPCHRTAGYRAAWVPLHWGHSWEAQEYPSPHITAGTHPACQAAYAVFQSFPGGTRDQFSLGNKSRRLQLQTAWCLDRFHWQGFGTWYVAEGGHIFPHASTGPCPAASPAPGSPPPAPGSPLCSRQVRSGRDAPFC